MATVGVKGLKNWASAVQQWSDACWSDLKRHLETQLTLNL